MVENYATAGFKFSYLLTDGPHHRNREGTNIATAQVLPFPLVAEELEFSFLLVVQAVAVAYLDANITYMFSILTWDAVLWSSRLIKEDNI